LPLRRDLGLPEIGRVLGADVRAPPLMRRAWGKADSMVAFALPPKTH
jgi:hypothetical protein